MAFSSPVSQTNRIVVLDILRGVALLGILLMNIPGFSMPDYFSEPFRTDTSSINFWVNAVIDILFEGKMRALFSIIFGAGIILFTMNKENSGTSATGLFYRRMAWLVLFGLIHSHILLWSGEILYYYGVVGMLAYLFRKLKPMYLIMAIPLVAILEFGLTTLFFQDIRAKRIAYVHAIDAQQRNQKLTEENETALKEWREVETSLIPNKEDAADHTRIMKSNYSTVASYIRKISWEGQTKYLLYEIWDPLALMLLGIGLFKSGFLSMQWRNADYVKTIFIGYGIGLPLVIFDFYYSFVNFPDHEAYLQFLERTQINWVALIYPAQRICLVMAHTSLIILIYRTGIFKTLFARLRAVGQMAFTNYIMHTVICSLIFFGYGLNYYAEIEFYKIYFIVLGIWVLQLVLSPIWLNHFLFGPLEWLWRCLTYWKIQPLRR